MKFVKKKKQKNHESIVISNFLKKKTRILGCGGNLYNDIFVYEIHESRVIKKNDEVDFLSWGNF